MMLAQISIVGNLESDADSDVAENDDFLNVLRVSLLETFAAITHALHQNKKGAYPIHWLHKFHSKHNFVHLFSTYFLHAADLMVQYLPQIAQFLAVIADDPNRSELVTEKATLLIG